MGQILKNGEVVVASDSKSRLWRDLSMRQATQNWNMMYADFARSPESALRAFTSSEGLANQLNEDEKSVKCGQEECKKHEKNVMIAGVSDEDKFVKCLDDIIGRESPWQAVKQAREKDLKYLREL